MGPAGPGRGLTVTGINIEVPKLHSGLNPLTEILPEIAEFVNRQVIWFVLAPESMVTPDGTVHSYKVVFASDEMK